MFYLELEVADSNKTRWSVRSRDTVNRLPVTEFESKQQSRNT